MWYKDIYIQTYFTASALFVGVAMLRRLSLSGKLVLLIILANLTTDLYTTYLAFHNRNTHLYNILLAIFEMLITLFIYSFQYEQKKNKSLIFIISAMLLGFAMYNLFFLQGLTDFNSYTFISGGFIIAIFSYLNIRLLILESKNLLTNVIFWFSVANFIYYIVVIPVMSAIKLNIEISIPLAASHKWINNIAYIIWAILIGIGFLCLKKKTN